MSDGPDNVVLEELGGVVQFRPKGGRRSSSRTYQFLTTEEVFQKLDDAERFKARKLKPRLQLKNSS